jgi:hypothetical protein
MAENSETFNGRRRRRRGRGRRFVVSRPGATLSHLVKIYKKKKKKKRAVFLLLLLFLKNN